MRKKERCRERNMRDKQRGRERLGVRKEERGGRDLHSVLGLRERRGLTVL